jgi:hypothetical protein
MAYKGGCIFAGNLCVCGSKDGLLMPKFLSSSNLTTIASLLVEEPAPPPVHLQCNTACNIHGLHCHLVVSDSLSGDWCLGVTRFGWCGPVPCLCSVNQALDLAKKMLNQTLVTKQTGPAGKPVNTLYIAKKMKLKREMYFAILLDRKTAGPVMIGCRWIITTAQHSSRAALASAGDWQQQLMPNSSNRNRPPKLGLSRTALEWEMVLIYSEQPYCKLMACVNLQPHAAFEGRAP